MSFFAKIADRMILMPSTDPIESEHQQRRTFESGDAVVEAWTTFQAATEPLRQRVVLLKFPGTAGRAERSGVFPSNCWRRTESQVWTVNHRGWGGSGGPATLANFAETCESAWDEITNTYPNHKVVLYGNSLGGISALYLAARKPAAGLFLRNTPPLKPLIATRPRYAWPSLGFSRFVANQIPVELDTVKNSKRSRCPLLFVRSELDRLVPGKYQRLILDAYAGPKTEFLLRQGRHASAIPENQESEFLEDCRWLEDNMLGAGSEHFPTVFRPD